MSLILPPSLPDLLAGWLPRARWFAAKGRPIERIEIADAAMVPAAGLALVLADVHAGGEVSRYALPLDCVTGDDASCTAGFANWLVDTALAGGSTAARRGRFVGHATGRASPAGDATRQPPIHVSPLGTDASNTSLRATRPGLDVAVKLLRRCRAGIQPEVEIGDFLAVEAAWRGTPRLRGWIDYVPDGTTAGTTAIATVHDFAAGCTSAWDHLVGLVQEGGLAGPHGGAILALVDRIGRVTGEMHAALASRSDLPAFAAEWPTAADRRHAAAAMVDHARRVFDMISTAAPSLPAPLAVRLRAVAARRDDLLGRLEARAGIDDGAAFIRGHGDYHLGQLLVSGVGEADPDRVLVIDFEGEPGRSLDERRRKTTACRDVAGMCRSFDYLLRHVARSGGPPHRSEDLRLIEHRFLTAYGSQAAGRPWWPASPTDASRLLSISALDKALYEIAYELANRPDWIEVPLAAIEAGQPPACALPNDRSGRPS